MAALQHQKIGEIFVKHFFQILDAIFSYYGVFLTHVQKANIIAFIKTTFPVKNTPFTFLLYPALFNDYLCPNFQTSQLFYFLGS